MEGQALEQALNDDAAQKAAAVATAAAPTDTEEAPADTSVAQADGDTGAAAPSIDQALQDKIAAQQARFADKPDTAAAPAATDQAPPAAAQATSAPTPQLIDASFLAKNMEAKNALVAKTVVMGLLDLCRGYIGAAMQTREKKNPDGTTTPELQDPGKVSPYLNLVEKALELAHSADALGDKPLART